MDRSFERGGHRLHGKLEWETDDFEKNEHCSEVCHRLEMDEEDAGWKDSKKKRMVKKLEGIELQVGAADHSCYP